MKVTPKTLRTIFLVIAAFAVAIVIFAAFKIFASPKSYVDEHGCTWQEMTPLQLSDYSDGSKNYEVKSAGNKHYLMSECKEP